MKTSPTWSLKEKASPEKLRALASQFQKDGFQEKSKELMALAVFMERRMPIAESEKATDAPGATRRNTPA